MSAYKERKTLLEVTSLKEALELFPNVKERYIRAVLGLPDRPQRKPKTLVRAYTTDSGNIIRVYR